ncbi:MULTISPECIES: hypothetical protein [Proteus]|uniref:hypothetical protein n=1 Tax=Proteus TaxID=583 RepID=UPI0013008FF9|nr:MULTISPECIES: hypothetical protein [Proteus]NBM78364.1 hypothetical protein [Proteus sp. G2659]MCX2587739.1 hypothetical protein [Proteus penneri]NBL77274.1 hypothetical protein [Proteus sp. G2672]NBL89558.1 hypothetical protein [Proteus sp. G2673]NBM02973.1 hypothetical protein [Proteus sp. G2671]
MNILMICQSQQTSSIIGLISVASMPIETLFPPPQPMKEVVVNTTVIVATCIA